jgi:hypothetical protein
MRERIKKKPVNKISETYKIGLKKYEEVKKQKRTDQIEGGFYRCYFCNKDMEHENNIDTHHVLGRVGDLLYDYRNIFFAHHNCHRAYHDMNVEQLMKTHWYKSFISRLSKINKRAYNQELRRLLKADVLDMQSYINEYK